MSGIRKIHGQQAGMVSIMVTMMMMIIISLIVLGFAQVSRREQRQSLDSQLSTQAFYAAESGVNDARSAILKILSVPGATLQPKTTCSQDTTNYPALTDANAVINATNNVSYPCLLINPTPKALTYSISGASTVIPLITSAGGFSGGLTFTWSKPTGETALTSACQASAAAGQFPPADSWNCPYGAIQADLVSVPAGTVTRSQLTTGTKAMFFTPTTSATAGTFNFASTTAGTVVPASCSEATASCSAKISGLAGNRYYLRVRSMYKSNFTLTISNTGGGAATFQNAQAIIDSTGRAQDVLRRVRVAIDTSDANAINRAGSALITEDSVCKRFSVADGYYDNEDTFAGGDDNQLCQSAAAGDLTSACVSPHDILLVLDASSSMTNTWEGITRLAELEKVADTFVDSTGVSAAGNHVGVVTFNTTPGTKLQIPFSTNATAIKNTINATTIIAGTNYYQGLVVANNEFNSPTDARSGVPQVMIFISDGLPDYPAYSNQQIIDYANTMKTNGVLTYAIGIVNGDGGAGILNAMASSPASTYYTTASTHINFEDFFAAIGSQITC